MSGFALTVAKWGPVILRCLPEIIKVGQDLYALWCGMRGTRQQNDAVLRAMKLLNRHQDDIDRLLQDPQQKRDLLEGLTILMNRINQHNGQAGAYGNNMGYPGLPTAPLSNGDCGASSSFSSSPKSFIKGVSWKACDVCQSEYNNSNKRPTILICGHTFCRDCLGEILQRGPLLCPTCRTHERRPLASLPPNTGLMRVLDEQEDKGDDICCSGGAGGCEDMPLSYEQQIEYAIFLSQQQAQNQGASYVEASWREVEEAEDESLARALQDSEIYEASRLCFKRYQAEGANGALDPPDKEKKEASLASALPTPDEDDASLLLAFELQQKEMVMMQRLRDGCSNGSDNDHDLMKTYHNFFGSSFCGPVEEDTNTYQEGENKNTDQEKESTEDTREEQQGQDEGDSAMCCSRNEDKGRKGDGDDCGKKCYEDDCGKEDSRKKCVALLKEEEELLIEMAIRLSLEQHEEHPSLLENE